MNNRVSFGVVVVGFIALLGLRQFADTETTFSEPPQVQPNWAAIASWPKLDAQIVEAQPDPNRRVTTIVLDDSGSMSSDMTAAKAAVIEALSAMDNADRVAVVALNEGIVLPFTTVEDARATLPMALGRVQSDGRTPLTRAVLQAQALLEAEASTMRGLGTFRMIVTTDGEANDGQALTRVVEEIAAVTPIQVTTIGIGIAGQHVLRRSDLGSFVDVANVAALADALQAAVAENTDFNAITDFSGTEG